MKKLVSLVILCVFLNSGQAQQNLSSNVFNLFEGNPGLNYEYILKNKIGLNLGADLTIFKWENGDTDDCYSGYRFTPEVRYYLNNNEDDKIKPFVGLYFRHRYAECTDEYSEDVYDSLGVFVSSNDFVSETIIEGQALGISFGMRFNIKEKFYLEYGLGFGAFLKFSDKTTTKNLTSGESTVYVDRGTKYENADINRLNVKIGFSFGIYLNRKSE